MRHPSYCAADQLSSSRTTLLRLAGGSSEAEQRVELHTGVEGVGKEGQPQVLEAAAKGASSGGRAMPAWWEGDTMRLKQRLYLQERNRRLGLDGR